MPAGAVLRSVGVPIALHRCGDFRLKGVDLLVGVVQALPAALEGRLAHFAAPESLKVGCRQTVGTLLYARSLSAQ